MKKLLIIFAAAGMLFTAYSMRPQASPTTTRPAARDKNSPAPPSLAGPQTAQPDTKAAAQAQAELGTFYLQLGRTSEAQTQCEKAFQTDLSNELARACLRELRLMVVDRDLDHAENLLLQGDRTRATAVASNWVNSTATKEQRDRAEKIVLKAKLPLWRRAWQAIPVWIRQTAITVVAILLAAVVVVLIRRYFKKIWSKKSFHRTIWQLQPLTEVAGSTDGKKATDDLLDAIARLGEELDREPWKPGLLLLRPTPPVNYEPAVISSFIQPSCASNIDLSPAMPELQSEWNLHEVQLDDAVQHLELKANGSIDVGSVMRLLMSVGKWITAGTPTISGSVEIIAETPPAAPATPASTAAATAPEPDSAHRRANVSTGSVSIHIAARGIGVRTISITTTSEFHAGIDCIQLAAERAAFKFLIRMKYPKMTNDEVSGHAALRQGVSLFTEFAQTIPGEGNAASTRSSSLKSAADNFAFFRSSIPVHCGAPDVSRKPGQSKSKSNQEKSTTAEPEGIIISDDTRQSVLLAEGVAHSLSGRDGALNSAIGCFRQLQEWPGSEKTLSLRQQGAYNEAIVCRSMGYFPPAVLMLTELLGDWDSEKNEKRSPAERKARGQAEPPEAIRLPARLARLNAFSRYSAEDWSILPDDRASFLIEDAEKLVTDLKGRSETLSVLHDRRLANYMHTEALRAIGHVELRRVIKGAAARFYCRDTNRPTGLLEDRLDENVPAEEEARNRLTQAIVWMRECEDASPDCGLFCDLSEANLLLKNFSAAQAYGRHATLQANPTINDLGQANVNPVDSSERAYYLVAEGFYLDGKKASSKKYAQRYYGGKAKLDEFNALIAKLQEEEKIKPLMDPT